MSPLPALNQLRSPEDVFRLHDLAPVASATAGAATTPTATLAGRCRDLDAVLGGPVLHPLWLNMAPQWVKDWATENGIQIPALPRQGGGGGGGRTGGGGSYRR